MVVVDVLAIVVIFECIIVRHHQRYIYELNCCLNSGRRNEKPDFNENKNNSVLKTVFPVEVNQSAH